MPKIRVHEKALAHLSRGLYRSPASALRELVSNAWDANAKVVRINTNYPLFFQLSVEDNGDGFSKEDFISLMDGGIGNSEKREEPAKLINNRPIIGRLGIGMLGIAQICGSFTITSKPRKGEGFRARVHLYDLLKERLDSDDEDIVKEIEVEDEEGEPTILREVDIGEYRFEEGFDLNSAKYGTIILTEDVHPTFIQTFRESLDAAKFPKFKKPTLEWSNNLKIISSVHSLQELGDYWRLLWELSASCPIPYLIDRALPKRLIADEQRRLESYDFKVFVDGIQLFKPVYLRGNPGGYTTEKIGVEVQKIYGKDVIFHGYLLVQEGKQILPDELRGILVRIKNIGIGYYDQTMLDYRFNEGMRAKWLTGEIYVDEGLEDALNIDRDSFNRFHPQFRYLQTYIHTVLHDQLFPEVYKQIDVRSKAKAKAKEEGRIEHLEEVLSEAVERPVKLKVDPKAVELDQEPKVILTAREKGVDIVIPPPDKLKTKKSNRQLATAILAIYEVASQEKARDKQREVFIDLLLQFLTRW
jgi:hypothetical protein